MQILSSEPEPGNKGSITLDIFLRKVSQEAPSSSHHFQQPSPSGVIVAMKPKMFGEFANSTGQQGYLNLRGASVPFVGFVLLNGQLFGGLIQVLSCLSPQLSTGWDHNTPHGHSAISYSISTNRSPEVTTWSGWT